MFTYLYDVVDYAFLGSMCLCTFFHVSCLDLHPYVLICLDSCSSMHMCQVSTCLHACFYAYISRSMFSHAYVLGFVFPTCFIRSSMCLCAPYHVRMPRSRLCLLCHMLL